MNALDLKTRGEEIARRLGSGETGIHIASVLNEWATIGIRDYAFANSNDGTLFDMWEPIMRNATSPSERAEMVRNIMRKAGLI